MVNEGITRRRSFTSKSRDRSTRSPRCPGYPKGKRSGSKENTARKKVGGRWAVVIAEDHHGEVEHGRRREICCHGIHLQQALAPRRRDGQRAPTARFIVHVIGTRCFYTLLESARSTRLCQFLQTRSPLSFLRAVIQSRRLKDLLDRNYN